MLALKSINHIQKELATRLKERRLESNLSQKTLSERSGVSYASLRRFENNGEISLKSLLMLAQALGVLKGFDQLFDSSGFTSLDELRKSVKKRKRGAN